MIVEKQIKIESEELYALVEEYLLTKGVTASGIVNIGYSVPSPGTEGYGSEPGLDFPSINVFYIDDKI